LSAVEANRLVQAALLGEAVDEAPVLVFVADENRRYVAVNRYACEVLGYTRDELLGLSVDEVARYDEAVDEYTDFVAQGYGEGTSRLTTKEGRTLAFRFRARTATVARMELFVAVGWPLDDAP
jgi:PAS domain S-box-containing protein